MKASSLVRGLFALALSFSMSAAALADTLVYPSAKNAMFLVDIPDDWTGEPAEEEGGFMNLEGPTGILISMRTVRSNEYTLDAAAEEARDFIEENYKDVNWLPMEKDATTWSQGGAGDNEGTPVIFSHVYLPADEHIFELRIVADHGDDKGVGLIQGIIGSIRSAK